MRQINRLSDPVRSRLRSGTIFSDIVQIAEELVCNSIDAGATQIQVDVDVEACFLQVDDDGFGISRDDLTIVGERYATSKLQDLEELERGVKTLGFRGEALSSLSDIAVVVITSRCRGTPNTYRKIVKDCATVSIGLCSQQRSHGTTVVVRDMFYNQPVRRRLMSTSHRKILQSVKERIVRFILMHPNISFKVMDFAREEVAIHSESVASLSSTLCGMFGEDLLHSLQEVDCCQDCAVFLYPPKIRTQEYVVEVPLKFRVHNNCGLGTVPEFMNPSISRSDTWIFSLTMPDINRRFVKKTPIHKLINKWAQSLKNGPRSMVGTSTQHRTWGRRGAGKQDGASEKHLLPAFVLNLTCPLSEYDITFEASKTMVEFKDWLPVVDFVRSVLQSMWGDLSGAPEGGSGRSPELTMEVDTRSKIIRQQISSVPHTCSKNIPRMSVRRALVQGDLVDLSSPVGGSVNHRVHDFTSPDSRQSGARPRNSTSPAPGARGGRGGRIYLSEALSNAAETSEKFPKQGSSHGSDRSIPERHWTLASCRQGETLSKSIQSSVPCIHTPGSPSVDDFMTLRLELSPDSASLTSPSVVEPIISSSDFSPITISPSLVKSRTKKTSVKSLNYDTRLPELSAFVEDVEVENGGASPEVPDLNMGSMLWSGSDDSYKNVGNPDFSTFLSDGSSRPPNYSDVQEKFSRTFSKSRCDEGGLVAKDKFRAHKQRLSVGEMYLPDNVSVDNFVLDEKWFRFKDCSQDVALPGQSERESFENLELEGYKVGNYQEIEQPLMERDGRNDSIRRPAYTSHQDESAKSSDSTRPRVKRKFEALFSGHLNNSGIRPDEGDGKYDFDDGDSCTSGSKRQRRSLSGPPFYKPPNRCGLHENPPNSLSTIKEGPVDTFERANYSKNSTGSTATERCETKSRASKDPECFMDKTSDSSSPSCSRKGLELNVDNALGRSHGVEDSFIRFIFSSEVSSVQLELPDTSGRGQNAAAPSDDAVEVLLKEWSNPCMTDDGGVLDLSSGILFWNRTSFLPDSLVKENLQHVRVLPQVDKKFIPAVADGVLLMIDQHAADERVRLEELRDHVLGTGKMKQVAPLSCPQELKITVREQQMLQTHREQIEDWGWRFRLPSRQSSESSRAGSSAVGTCNVLLSAIPCILGVKLTGDDLTEYLRQLIQGSSAPPPSVTRVLNYKACRGAIMFGDTLLPAESRQLIEHLKQTHLCFQCAHGRPTMVPLVDLRALHKRLRSSDNTWGNVEDFELPSGLIARKSELPVKEWHRLKSRKITLERSLERLNRAKQ